MDWRREWSRFRYADPWRLKRQCIGVNPKNETASYGNKYIEWSEEMDLSRAVYSRDLKVTAMRALDAGATTAEIARKYQLSPKLLERWRGEWRARGEAAFPGIGRRAASRCFPSSARAHSRRNIGRSSTWAIPFPITF